MLVAAMVLASNAQDSPPPAEGGDLPIPSLAFGLITFGLLMFLLLLTYAFRSIGKRH